MNATQSYAPPHPHHYMDPGHQHMGAPHGHATTSGPSYAPYPQPSSMIPMGGYSGYYPYGNHVSAPQPAHHTPHYSHHSMALPTMPTSQPPSSAQAGSQYPPQHIPDETGQVAPPGHKPKLTGTVWEDEGTVCFQVEVNGICVARREDNCFINGTKLLNVANMTRGRRDGLLKSEKTRHVTKIGPMHLKGVWIPYDRALEFANKEKITEQLYPLFLHNIGPLVAPHFSPQSQSGRRSDGAGSPSATRTPRPAQTSQAPSMPNQSSAMTPQNQTSQSIPPQSSSGRPGLDRANTFPTPPTSATSAVGVSNANNSYDWPSSAPTNSALQLDTGLNTKSLPATPTTTPPDHTIPNVHYTPNQGYDGSRHAVYSAPHQQTQYVSNHNMGQAVNYGQMQPPSRNGPDEKLENGDDRDYVHDYQTNAAYGYADTAHLSSDLKGSPHHTGSGRETPRAVNSQQSPWQGYQNQQRSLPSSNLSHVMSDSRNTNGYTSIPSYGAPQHTSSKKRGRDIDDDEGNVYDTTSMKRRKNVPTGYIDNMTSSRSSLVHQ